MFRTFYPKEYVDSTYVIDFDSYAKKGYKGVIFDIDNTLVSHGAPSNEAAVVLFKSLREFGFQTVLLSNNKEPRVKPFADRVKSKYVYNAHKPSRKNYFKAMELMGTTKENTIFLGDQIFTDVWGANRAGIKSYMVEKINPKEEIQIVLKRIPEKFVLWCWRRKNEK